MSIDEATAASRSALRLLLGVDQSGPVSLAVHRATYPTPPTSTGRAVMPIVETVLRSGLRGRGGAGFPTGVKMQTVARSKGAKTVVVNGSEGEPVSQKDKVLLTRVPHLVLDGAAIAATAVGANEVVIALERGSAGEAVVAHAIEERRPERGVAIRLVTIPRRYVAGEESALVHFINGGEAKPVITPPRVFERGVDGRPTLLDNVETLAHVAQIAAFGADWFRQFGLEDQPGTMLVTVTGAVDRPGVREVPIGTPIASLVTGAGGALLEGTALLVGGYYGAWITAAEAAGARMAEADLRALGASVGCGSITVLGPESCGWRETARVLAWYASETAGQCGPCVHGLADMATQARAVAEGKRVDVAARRVIELGGRIEGRGACKFPDGAVRLARSAVRVFADEAALHAAGRCRARSGAGVFPIPDVRSEPWR